MNDQFIYYDAPIEIEYPIQLELSPIISALQNSLDEDRIIDFVKELIYDLDQDTIEQFISDLQGDFLGD